MSAEYPIEKYVLWFIVYEPMCLDEEFLAFETQMVYYKMQLEIASRRVPGPLQLQKWEPSDPDSRAAMKARGEHRYYFIGRAWNGPKLELPMAAYAVCGLCHFETFVIADVDNVGLCDECRRFAKLWPQAAERQKDRTKLVTKPW